jgi:hypothetical protein
VLGLGRYSVGDTNQCASRTRRMVLSGETPEVCEVKPLPVPHFLPQIPHGMSWDRNRSSPEKGLRLTACTTARPIEGSQPDNKTA